MSGMCAARNVGEALEHVVELAGSAAISARLSSEEVLAQSRSRSMSSSVSSASFDTYRSTRLPSAHPSRANGPAMSAQATIAL
jgi:hypothetical protein